MADDCKTNEACDEQAPILGTTGTIVYDGTEFTCEDDAELALLSSDKLNAILLLLFQKLCSVNGDVQDIIATGGDGFIQDVSFNESNGIITFTGLGGAFNGTIDISSFSSEVDYINGGTLGGASGALLTLTGVGNAGASIELESINGTFTNITFDGTNLIFTGQNSQGNFTVDISGVNTDTNDIDYINQAALVGATLNLTGIGNAGASVNLQPIIDQAVTDAIAGGAGGGDDSIVGETFSGTGSSFPATAFTAGVDGSKILTLFVSQWVDGNTLPAVPGTTCQITIGNIQYFYDYADFDAGNRDILELLNAPTDEFGQRYLNLQSGDTIEIIAVTDNTDSITVAGYGFDY
jgi:hypothetical protein